MKKPHVSEKYLKGFSAMLFGAMIALSTVLTASADPISPDTQAKVEQYKKKLAEWASNAAVIAAVKASNAKGGLVHDMTNAKWDELKDNDPAVAGILSSAASKHLVSMEEDKGINKLYARDEKGNWVAGGSKPALYNNAARAPFKNAITGKAYSDAEAKADPTTQIKSVQVSVPIMSDGKPIGVLHTAVNAK